jgi:hypothetical protein
VVDGGLKGVAHEIVETPVTRIEQVKDFDTGILGREMLNGLADVPCGNVFPLAESGC